MGVQTFFGIPAGEPLGGHFWADLTPSLIRLIGGFGRLDGVRDREIWIVPQEAPHTCAIPLIQVRQQHLVWQLGLVLGRPGFRPVTPWRFIQSSSQSVMVPSSHWRARRRK
jgi:hypothetical protein